VTLKGPFARLTNVTLNLPRENDSIVPPRITAEALLQRYIDHTKRCSERTIGAQPQSWSYAEWTAGTGVVCGEGLGVLEEAGWNAIVLRCNDYSRKRKTQQAQ
jgi:hypothetical protein